MDEFPGLLAKDFGFRPQGKSAPMAASKGTNSINSGGNLNVGIRSGGDSRSASFSSNRSKSGWNSNSVGGSFLDDHDGLFGSTATQKTQDYGGFGGYDDVFGGPPKFDNRKETRGGGAPSASSFDYDSIFQGSKDSSAKLSSLPVFDKPKYDDDDDIFRGLPGMKGSSAAATANNDDVFASISSPPKQSAAFDDLLGNFNRKEPDSKSSSGRRSEEVVKDASGFDDLLPGFGGSSPKNRATSKTNQPQQSTVPSTKSTASVMDDPFVVLESTSTPVYQPSGLFTDPLEQMSKASNSRSSKFDGSLHSGKVLDDMDPLDSLGKSVPMFSPEMNDRLREKSPLRTGSMEGFPGKESNEKSSVRASEHTSQKKVPVDNYRESHQTLFDIPSVSSDSNKPPGHAGSRRSFVNASYNETSSQADMSPKSENIMEGADDIWLTVSEVPLFTQPTSAPPPSRPPPPRPAQVSRGDKGSFAPVNTKKVNEFPTFPHSTQNFQSSRTVPASVNNSGVSSIDELEDFATGRCRSNADESADILSSEEDIETNSAAAAMKEAMDRAEAKFKHAKEVRERETARSGRSREVAHDAQERELREKQEKLDREREQKEREDKEREQRRLERERERAREIEMEKARQAVERATREARERAAAEVRLKAERAQAEARERAAVQRVQAEARERAGKAAIEARERAAAEARERAASEAREKEARERAAVSRAEAEVRLRAERAAVERAAAEARERAAAEARERAAAAATASQNQQKNDNDLESFFSNMGGRPSSVPRPRPNTDPFETQFQNKGGSDGPRRTSSGTSPSMKKASSTTNIVDDLSSIFGGTSSPSGEFQEIKGETEERRKARLERHQRTNERAAKALAEKNQRDLQTQQDQAERHRIAETLDIEIKRWAAGKETNLRALLSTLQYVLWPECGWQPVSLTDLITAASVKKVYRKATLCIHPDKVQQKGANIQQKYIAEKVFDLLKESWNKFNSEELF
ncbi:hypothetical protein NE237_027099 [Protea cynaroides]|uniref:Uncharacterized protein n=1 Tax=Protea cynaroides TaxID=273540 RepID=A0A9Q0JSV9_9MAGN|nr:hypothetical protein NE237_027099 [Protea cynaroides]